MPSSENAQTPPPSGWQLPPQDGAGADDSDLMARLAELFGEFVPVDLQRRLAEAVRELLVALRALIDWLVERLEQRRGDAAAEVRDIPIL